MFPQERRNNRKSKKVSKKRKALFYGDSEDKDLDQGQKVKIFFQYHVMDQCTILKALVKEVNKKTANNLPKQKGSPRMK